METISQISSTSSFPNYLQYCASYHRQRFSLPSSIIYYITKKPSTSKIYQKLIQCCKYFFLKNPILVFHWLVLDENGWEADSAIKIDLKKISAKIWITTYLNISKTDDSSMASNLIPKLYQCDAKSLELRNQIITFKEFRFLSKFVGFCCLDRITVTCENGQEAQCETIIANLPALKGIKYIMDPKKSPNISSKTVKELLKIPHFSDLEQFNLINVSEDFDIKMFYEFLKNNKHIKSGLLYRNHPFSEKYKNELDGIVDEMLESNSSNYIITYPGQERENLKILYKLWQKNFK